MIISKLTTIIVILKLPNNSNFEINNNNTQYKKYNSKTIKPIQPVKDIEDSDKHLKI